MMPIRTALTRMWCAVVGASGSSLGAGSSDAVADGAGELGPAGAGSHAVRAPSANKAMSGAV